MSDSRFRVGEIVRMLRLLAEDCNRAFKSLLAQGQRGLCSRMPRANYHNVNAAHGPSILWGNLNTYSVKLGATLYLARQARQRGAMVTAVQHVILVVLHLRQRNPKSIVDINMARGARTASTAERNQFLDPDSHGVSS